MIRKSKKEPTEKDYVGIARQYARDVVSGKISACKWVKLACQRQLDDLKRKSPDWPYRFDRKKATRVCKFVELLPHIKGRWSTGNITLDPWQCFVLTALFGWVDRHGVRRFRKALIVIPRKAGKSTIAAAVGLYLLALDGENSADCFSAATTRDQAKITWELAKRMVERSPGFRHEYGIEPLAHSIIIESAAASFKPLSRDVDALEGLNPHGAIIDELHAHGSRELFDVINEATGARTQPLLFIISTEGDNPTGVFAEQRDYLETILEGSHDNPSYFGIIYTIDTGDDWLDRRTWYKANPAIEYRRNEFGMPVLEKDYEDRCREARKTPASQASFLTKRLNVRVGAGEAYFNMLAFRTICKDPKLRIEDFYGQEVHIGLDLATRSDLAAKVYLFQQGRDYICFGKYYLPESAIEKGNPNYDFYRGWADQDLLTLTPGTATEYEFIEEDILLDHKNFRIKEVDFDPAQALYLEQRLKKHGITMVEIPQNVMRLSEPMKQLGHLIGDGRFKHNGDPVLDWTFGNVMAKKDAKSNVYPIKARETSKIDPPVAAIMAGSRKFITLQRGPSVYETRGIITF